MIDILTQQIKNEVTKLGVTEDDVVSMNRRLGGDGGLPVEQREETLVAGDQSEAHGHLGAGVRPPP